jgi:hypothetical protein
MVGGLDDMQARGRACNDDNNKNNNTLNENNK